MTPARQTRPSQPSAAAPGPGAAPLGRRYPPRLLWALRAALAGLLAGCYLLEGWVGSVAVVGDLAAFVVAVDTMSYAEDGVHVQSVARLVLAVALFVAMALLLARFGTTGAWR